MEKRRARNSYLKRIERARRGNDLEKRRGRKEGGEVNDVPRLEERIRDFEKGGTK